MYIIYDNELRKVKEILYDVGDDDLVYKEDAIKPYEVGTFVHYKGRIGKIDMIDYNDDVEIYRVRFPVTGTWCSHDELIPYALQKGDSVIVDGRKGMYIGNNTVNFNGEVLNFDDDTSVILYDNDGRIKLGSTVQLEDGTIGTLMDCGTIAGRVSTDDGDKYVQLNSLKDYRYKEGDPIKTFCEDKAVFKSYVENNEERVVITLNGEDVVRSVRSIRFDNSEITIGDCVRIVKCIDFKHWSQAGNMNYTLGKYGTVVAASSNCITVEFDMAGHEKERWSYDPEEVMKC